MPYSIAVTIGTPPCQHLTVRATDTVSGEVVYEESLHLTDVPPARTPLLATALRRAMLTRIAGASTPASAKAALENAPLVL